MTPASGRAPASIGTRMRGSRAAVVLALLLAATTQPAFAEKRSFRIESQDASAALMEFGRQSGLQILFAYERVKGFRTNALAGDYEPIDAIRLMIEGTRLQVTEQTGGVLVVGLQGEDASASAWSTNGYVRLAQAEIPGEGELHPTPAGAAAQPGGAAIEEVVVTANRRTQRLADVPMSVSALSQATIDRASIRSFLDLARSVPGLVVAESGPGQNRIFMRGVANGNSSTSLVGIYLDEMPVSGSAYGQLDLQLVDLDRVEVLRGPQGTLYGQGSAGGTIRFITRQPDLAAYSGRIDIESFGTEHGEESAKVSGVVNIPIVQDVLGIRASGVFADLGGWVDQPAAGRKDINNQNLRHVRIKGLWTPTQALKVDAFVVVHRNEGDGIAAGVDANNDVFFPNGDPLAREKLVDDYTLYNASASYDFGPATLLSSTSYTRSEKQADGYAVKMPGFESFNEDSQDNEVFSQELRLSSAQSGRLQWVVGSYYTDESFDRLLLLNQYSDGEPLGVLPLPTLDTSRAWSVFGDASYDLTERLEVGTGVRYFHDRRGQVSGDLDLHNNFRSVDPRFYASFALTPQVRIYANAGKGFRSGGFSGDTTARTFGPEDVWSYEAGVKGATAGRRLRYELTGFYSRYKDIQTFAQTTIILGGLVNSGTARIRGVDWLLAFDPIDSITLQASGNTTDAELIKVLPTSFSNVVGDRVDFVPDYSVSLSGEYRFEWADVLHGFARVDYNQIGKSTYTDHSAGVVGFPSDTLQFLNARLGVQYGRISAELFGQNLLGENGIQDPLASFGLGSRPRPRVIGVKLGATF